MKVILVQTVKNLGKKNTIVDVSDGYALNYLFPKKIAIPVSEKNLEKMNYELEIQKKNDEKIFNDAKQVFDQLNDKELLFYLKTHDHKIFGQVTSKMIVEKINEFYNVKIDKHALLPYSKLQIGKNEILIKNHPKLLIKMFVVIKEE